MDQAGSRAVLEAPDQRSQTALFAKDIAEVLRRVSPLMAVVRAAAESEPALEELYVGLYRSRTRGSVAKCVGI